MTFSLAALCLSCGYSVHDDYAFDSAGTSAGAETESGSGGSSSATTGGGTTDATTDATTGGTTDVTTGGTTGAATTGAGALCGDGVISGSEECDCGNDGCSADEFDGAACTDFMSPDELPFNGGALHCNPASCKVETTSCTWCGDGEVNGPEDCEAQTEATCVDLGLGLAGDVTCSESCALATSSCTFCYQELTLDAQGCDQGWTTGTFYQSAGNSWECGDPTAYVNGPGTDRKGMWATGLAGDYLDGEASWLASPTISLTPCANEGVMITIEHWHNFEGGATNSDGGLVELSNDGGSTWTAIAPVSGDLYAGKPIEAAIDPPDGHLGFGGISGNKVWKASTFDVSAYAGQDISLRFVFGSDASTSRGGWYIDTIRVQGTGA